MNKNPCWKCNNRCVGCHGSCERYGEWRKEYEANANTVRESKARATDYLAARRQLQFTNTAKWGV